MTLLNTLQTICCSTTPKRMSQLHRSPSKQELLLRQTQWHNQQLAAAKPEVAKQLAHCCTA